MVDLRPHQTPIKNQGRRGTCVAFAATAAHETLWADGVDLSEEFLYWAAKQRDGCPRAEGTTLAAAAAALTVLGQPPETDWPYDPACDHFAASYQPPASAIVTAKPRCIHGGSAVPANVDDLRTALEEGATPLLVVELYESWHVAGRVGRIAMPAPAAPMLGGHAVPVVGFVGWSLGSDSYFIVRNSWSAAWGDNGYGYLPYDYVRAHGRSVWVLAK